MKKKTKLGSMGKKGRGRSVKKQKKEEIGRKGIKYRSEKEG